VGGHLAKGVDAALVNVGKLARAEDEDAWAVAQGLEAGHCCTLGFRNRPRLWGGGVEGHVPQDVHIEDRKGVNLGMNKVLINI